ncbi:MAG: HAD-IA family hydrolase [Colwellia sp.]|nr:HAD-IA family hydrolase [Colwellia sp.]
MFDFDGTIANSFPLFLEIVQDLSKTYDYRCISAIEGENLRSHPPKYILEYLRLSRWKIPFYGYTMKKRFRNSIVDVKLFSGMIEEIKILKDSGVRLAIVSGNSKENVKVCLGSNGIDIFDDYVCDVGFFRKSKHIKKLIHKNGFRLNEVLYIGDEIRDIQASKNTGIDIGCVSWGFNTLDSLIQHKPNFVFNAPHEISRLLTLD